jgi:hypothetical protein
VQVALAPRHRRVARALSEALLALPHRPAEGPDALEAIVDRFEAHVGAVSRSLRPLLLLALDWLRWLPLVLFVALRPFEDLPVGARTSLLERMERSRSPLLFLPFVAFKTLLSMMHFEEDGELRELGYPGEDRVRWKHGPRFRPGSGEAGDLPS